MKLLWLLTVLFLLSSAHLGQAQQPGKIARIGYMHSGAKPDNTVEAFQRGLRDLGYVEGKSIVVEYRYAAGKVERFPELAAELVRSKVDIIVAVNDVGARAAKNATEIIPVVMVSVGPNPVDVGLVESLARPGGNLTG